MRKASVTIWTGSHVNTEPMKTIVGDRVSIESNWIFLYDGTVKYRFNRDHVLFTTEPF